MVRISAEARAHLDGLDEYYLLLGRDAASRRMSEAVAAAGDRIVAGVGPFFSAPRPYPELARLGGRWLKEHVYWVAFDEVADGHVMTAVFHEGADIPGRL